MFSWECWCCFHTWSRGMGSAVIYFPPPLVLSPSAIHSICSQIAHFFSKNIITSFLKHQAICLLLIQHAMWLAGDLMPQAMGLTFWSHLCLFFYLSLHTHHQDPFIGSFLLTVEFSTELVTEQDSKPFGQLPSKSPIFPYLARVKCLIELVLSTSTDHSLERLAVMDVLCNFHKLE